MKDWFSGFLTDRGPQIYDRLQALRADYGSALAALRDCAAAATIGKPGRLRVLDVACGTGIASRVTCESWPSARKEVVGLDYDAGLLAAAKALQPEMKIKRADMVRASFTAKFDLILCSFAYHHATDAEKPTLCHNLRRWVKADGDVLVLEICLRSGEVKPYYDQLIRDLRQTSDRDLGRHFLEWTMSGDRASTGEWKVPLRRVRADFAAAGFSLASTKQIWTAPGLSAEAGCYLLHFQPLHGPLQRHRQLGGAAVP